MSREVVGISVTDLSFICDFAGAELAYQRVPGVVSTKVGYTQGQMETPTYQQVCSGSTGHAEAVAVDYDPEKVSFEKLVDLFWERLGGSALTLNQVGNDVCFSNLRVEANLRSLTQLNADLCRDDQILLFSSLRVRSALNTEAGFIFKTMNRRRLLKHLRKQRKKNLGSQPSPRLSVAKAFHSILLKLIIRGMFLSCAATAAVTDLCA